MDYASLSDETLIRLIERRQAEALAALYDRYGRLVFSLARNVVGDPAVAEEIAQDVFVRVWEKAGSYRVEQARVSTWLTSITRYRAIDILRQQGVRPERYSVGWDDLAPNLAPIADENPEGQAELALVQQRVRLAVDGLPPDQREALALAFFQGLSHSQVAERLGEPLGTVKTRIRLAMHKLRDILREDLPLNPPWQKHS